MSNGKISKRANIFDFPSFRYYYRIIEEKTKKGKRIYNLFKLNPYISLLGERTETTEEGLTEKFANFYKIPKSYRVLAFPGTIPALSTIFFTFLDTNDEVLLPEPILHYLSISSAISQVRLKVIKTYYYNNFSIPSRDFIEPLITPRVKLFFISNPQFFSGNVYSEEEMERVIFLSNTYRIPVILDETFSFSVFENVFFRSAFELVKGHQNIFIINRLIEVYSDENIVFVITNPEIYEILRRYRDELYPVSSQLINAGNLFLSRFISGIGNLRKKIFDNSDYIYKAVLSKDISVIKPFAGPCMILKIPTGDSDSFIDYMINSFEENGSSAFAMPMSDFFVEKEKGKELLVINFSNLEKAEMEEGIRILKLGLENYLKEVQ